ncbi:DUF1801 domain-containing protein [Rufibacter sp. LB8]|uniref:DUF1801 domain-containing protein n=1 Tax=Rufibacter sp. LB8 TaxID=2777781 RepID=UPI00178C6F6D|nr:DUF1801 domain-containing protein [Rufibacter sp. LB8]
MLKAIDAYFLALEEPTRGCLQFLRAYLLAQDSQITEAFKHGVPFFYYKGKSFCYFWWHKKRQQPYIGFIRGAHLHNPLLLQEKRTQIKILLLNPEEDLPMDSIEELLEEAKALY